MKKYVENAVLLALPCIAEVQPLSFFRCKQLLCPNCPKVRQIYSMTIRWQKAAIWTCLFSGFSVCGCQWIYPQGAILKLHIEEDAGKTKNERRNPRFVDYHRCGVRWFEMVPSPICASADEAGQ
jgi:Asp-tRNA(Asn)/Glu-tRNA(Gln) amidotransferase B subunit